MQQVAAKEGTRYEVGAGLQAFILLAELGYSDMVDGPWKVVGDNAQAEVWAREWAIRFRVVKELYVVVGVLQDRNSLEFE